MVMSLRFLVPTAAIVWWGMRLHTSLLRIEERLILALTNAATHVCDILLERRTLSCSRETQANDETSCTEEVIVGSCPSVLSHRLIRELCEECLCVREECRISEVIRLLQKERSSCCLVTRGPTLLGVFELDDVLRYVLRDAMDATVGCAVRPCCVVSDDSPMKVAFEHLRSTRAPSCGGLHNKQKGIQTCFPTQLGIRTLGNRRVVLPSVSVSSFSTAVSLFSSTRDEIRPSGFSGLDGTIGL